METPKSSRATARTTGMVTRRSFNFGKIGEEEEAPVPTAITAKNQEKVKDESVVSTSTSVKKAKVTPTDSGTPRRRGPGRPPKRRGGKKTTKGQVQEKAVVIDSQSESGAEQDNPVPPPPESSSFISREVKGKGKGKAKVNSLTFLESAPESLGMEDLEIEDWMLAELFGDDDVGSSSSSSEEEEESGGKWKEDSQDAEDYASIRIRTVHEPPSGDVKGILRRNEGKEDQKGYVYPRLCLLEICADDKDNDVKMAENVQEANSTSPSRGNGQKEKRRSECQPETTPQKRVKFATPMTAEREYKVEESDPDSPADFGLSDIKHSWGCQGQEDPRSPHSDELLSSVNTRRSLRSIAKLVKEEERQHPPPTVTTAKNAPKYQNPSME